MDKDYSLQCLDYAISKTIDRSYQDQALVKLNSVEHLSEAVIKYMMEGNALGFSSNGDGRKYIQGLSREDIEEQLLKHVIKSDAAKTKKGIAQQLGINKSFDDELDYSDVQALLFKSMSEMNMDGIRYLLDKYPSLYRALVGIFITDRYFNNNLGIDVLDSAQLDYQHSFHYNKIEEYYKQLKNNKEEGLQR